MEAAAVRDWSALPVDLLGIIAMHVLTSSVDDFMAFRGVCNSWRDKRVANYSKSWPSLPYLMLQGKNGKHERPLYSLTKRKICRTLSLPEISGKHCIEARFGWLLTVANSREVKLFNPFSRSEIELPNFENLSWEVKLFHMTFFCILRAVLSKNPAENSQFVLVVLLDNKSLVFWRKGDRNWTRIESLGDYVIVKDVNYSNRDQRFYVVGDNGNIWGWDHGHDFACTKLELMFSVWPCDTDTYSNFVQAYLMESTSACVGELFLVTRSYSRPSIENNFTSETTKFKIFKFDVETVGKTKVEEIKRLENETIFVGPNAAICIAISGAIEPNCIYFSDDCAGLLCNGFAKTREMRDRVERSGGSKKLWRSWKNVYDGKSFEDENRRDHKGERNQFDGEDYEQDRCYHDTGIYHLQNESIEWFDDAIQELGILFPPLWIAPSHFFD